MPTGWFSQEPPFEGHPYLTGMVRIPRLGVARRVDFLVDTGCSVTTINPWDSTRMGLDFAGLSRGGLVVGIGGSVREFTEEAEVSFPHGLQVVTYRLPIDIAPPLDHNRWLPSLLGMDVLRRWRMVCDARGGELAFDVHDADSVYGLGTTP